MSLPDLPRGLTSATPVTPPLVPPIALTIEGTLSLVSSAQPVPTHTACWVFPPHLLTADERPARWVLALPGGSYRGLAYYDRQVPGESPLSYSMARYLAAHGIGVIVIDNLGTGQSTAETEATALTRPVLAAASHQLLRHLRMRLERGTLLPGLASVARPWIALMGHSMGGYLAVGVQGRYGSADALVLLGWANGVDDTLREAMGLTPDALTSWMQQLDEAHLPEARQRIRSFFYSSRVPASVIAADEQDATIVPAGLLAGLAEAMQPPQEQMPHTSLAASIHCPVFLGFGGVDVTRRPHLEVACYPLATDITLFVQPEAHHCTTFEPERFVLWHRIADWCESITTAPLTHEPRQQRVSSHA